VTESFIWEGEMELFLCVLVDIIHFITILFTCKFFFMLQMREVKNKGLMLFGAFSIVTCYYGG